MSPPDVVIVSAVRTPIGSFGGNLSSIPATELGALVIKAALDKLDNKELIVDQVIMGQVLTAGCGQAPARQAAIKSGLPQSTACLTLNKVCGSGLKAVMLGYDAIRLGESQVVVAGGMESMSNVPYLLPKARSGYRLGHGELVDSLIKDGLWDVYNDFHMGSAAELCAEECKVDRETQDAFAIQSYQRAQKAIEQGLFKNEIVPVEVTLGRNSEIVSEDEEPSKVKFEKIPNLKTVFKKKGTITAANASSLNDGAAALVLMSRAKAESLGLTILAQINSHATFAREPEWFTLAPGDCIQRLMDKSEYTLDDIDLFEINEAFAVVNLAVGEKLKLSQEKMNIHGGAVALGHPIGASGARILVTLIHALQAQDKKRGVASLCIGGGEAVAVLIER